ncbi:MAG: acetoacetate decarboxylase family protein [Candidatus Thorarchaeota archaeon]|jgi:acetoacetate decarboxylase
MKFDSDKFYMMPLIMGPIGDRKDGMKSVYGKVHSVGFQYLTDPDSIKPLLPDCYTPAQEPLVAVMFSYYDDIDFMAGGGYNVATVQVAVRFDGEEDHVDGDYPLILLEDHGLPIVTGREMSGIPKMFGDIPPIETLADGNMRCETSFLGNTIFGLEVGPLKEQNRVVRAAAARMMNKNPLLGYKYIPSYEGPPDASYPTTLRYELKIDKLWLGKTGSVFYGELEGELRTTANPLKSSIDALKSLVVKEMKQTLQFQGSMVLRNDLSKRLK